MNLGEATTLGEVLLRIETGKSVQTLDRPSRAQELGILKLSAVTWGAFRPEQNKAILPGYDPGRCPRPTRGDILITRANTRELVGASVLVRDDFPRLLLSDKILRLVPNDTKVDRRYLVWALGDKLTRRFLSGLAGGTSGSMANITQEDIRSIPLSLPMLADQRRIADILDQSEALRSKRRAALALLDTLTQAVFLEMFGDPVANPRRWVKGKFGQAGTLDRGVSKHRPRNASELLGGPHPLVQTGEVANCDGYIRSYNNTYSDLGLRQSKMWPSGTLCITIAANIAKTGILTFDACFPDSVVGFNAADPATVEYVRVWLSFLQKALEDSAPESAQKNINLAILRDLDIPLPPLSLQQDFARRVAAVDKLKAAHRASLAEMDALFASLQHRAFRGEL